MRSGRLWLIPALWAAFVFACAQDGPNPVPEHGVDVLATPAVRASSEIGQQAATPTATPDVDSAREQLKGGGRNNYGGLINPHPGLATLEETILQSDTIARVDYLRSIGSVARTGDWWMALLEFRFEVNEYLKGSGPDEIGAFIFFKHDTEAGAQRAAALLAAAHDTRWDDREAILFLNYIAKHIAPPIELGAGQFWLAAVGNAWTGYVEWYSVASDAKKLWLPAATQPTRGTRGSESPGSSTTTPRLFMLDVPSGTARQSVGARSTAGGPTISLADLKSKITALEAEANAGGTAEYRECVESYYRQIRWTQRSVDALGYISHRHSVPMDSGLPAGTVVQEYPSLIPKSEKPASRLWYEGPDKDLMRFTRVHFNPPPDVIGSIKYTLQSVTARPLPAGTYTFFPNGGRIETCGKDWSFDDNRVLYTLTVTPPELTLHEAFFDPVDIGSAVGADSSNGVLEPNAFMLNGATTTISSLKWEDGAVSMTLNPTASLADYAIDFIDVTGTTTLSLTSDNASTTALAWTVPDKPWADGDLLMLRIYEPISNDATLSALTLSGVDLAFDPATTTYAASVPATTTQTTVTPTLNHDATTYVVKLGGVVDDDGTIPLAAGANVITIDVTAEDAVTTETYTVTITRATPTEPITVTLTPRIDGSSTYVNIAIEWNDPQSCDGQYMVALYTSSDYVVRFMGFHPAPETTSLSRELYTRWGLEFFPAYSPSDTCCGAQAEAKHRRTRTTAPGQNRTAHWSPAAG